MFKIWESVESISPQNHYPLLRIRSDNICILHCINLILFLQFVGITRIYRNLQEFTGIYKNFVYVQDLGICRFGIVITITVLVSGFDPITLSRQIAQSGYCYSNSQELQEFTGITGIYRNFGYDNDLSLEFEIYVLYTILIDFGE